VGKFRKNESGFGAVEIIVVVAIVILIIAVGWLIKDNSKTKTPTTTTSTTKSVTSEPPQSNPALVLQRQEYVDNYIGASNKDYTAAYYTSLYNNGYITKSAYDLVQSDASKYTAGSSTASTGNPAYNKLICVKQLPSSFTYTLPVISSNSESATVSVTESFSNSSTTSQFTANWVGTNGVWQFNGMDCSS
jgi:hypothetical protein